MGILEALDISTETSESIASKMIKADDCITTTLAVNQKHDVNKLKNPSLIVKCSREKKLKECIVKCGHHHWI